MEKDIGKIVKNPDTDIVLRIDDFGGKVGLTIREYVKGERYTGFTKAGTRIPVDKFVEFKKLVNSINEKELETIAAATSASSVSNVTGNSITTGKQSTISPESGKKDSKSVKAKLKSNIEDMAM